jgi:hypothetical protein
MNRFHLRPGCAQSREQNGRGQSGSYEVELTQEGHLQFVLQEDPCFPPNTCIPEAPWDRVEP